MASEKQQKPERTVLVSPDGKKEWTPEDATEETNLRARGWSARKAADATENKAVTKAPNKAQA